MGFSFRKIIPLLLLISRTTFGDPICKDITIPVTISATNVQVPSVLTLPSLVSFFGLSVEKFIDTPIAGTYKINGRYCEPEVKIAGRSNTLQFLNHGLAQSLHYWSGIDIPTPFHGSNYSWTAYASKQGYPTFAIDRLGSGLSDHPDPITTVQLPAQVEVAHELIASINRGILGRRFTEVVYIGHSFGSIVGHGLNVKYPKDVKRTILTGWTRSVDISGLGVLLSDLPIPAAWAQPARFGGLPLGYIEALSQIGDASLGFAGALTPTAGKYYDRDLANRLWEQRGTETIGEIYTLGLFAGLPADSYNGKVLVQTGEKDSFFCGIGFGDGNCGQGATSIPAKSKSLYPSASSYDYFIPPNTGHATVLHYTQQLSFDNAHKWLASTA